MDALLNELDAQFGELVSRISHLERLEDQSGKIAALDARYVHEVTYIKEQVAAGVELARLRRESAMLDQALNAILIELAQCRRELEKQPASESPRAAQKVNEADLLQYATKITKFTQKMPGSAESGVLPWPAEDQLRRGMLATLTIQNENPAQPAAAQPAGNEPAGNEPIGGKPLESKPLEFKPSQQPPADRAPARPRQKINLDFDSDDD